MRIAANLPAAVRASPLRLAALLLAVAAAAIGVAVATTGAEDDVLATEERVAAELDLSRTRGRDAPFLRRIDYSALYVATVVDRIPAIDEPVFETPAEASRLLPPESLVVGVERNGDARAYPTNLLSLHEVVNDVVGGDPIAISWCPLCSTALAYDRRVEERVLSFGVSGYLYHANLVLYDRQTGSLWSQLVGGAVTGRYRGTRLRTVPVSHQTWESWRAAHPDTKVLSIRRDRFAHRFTDPSVEPTAYGDDFSDVPYSAYATKLPYYARAVVRGVSDATRVYGIVVRGRAKAYPLGLLRRRGVIRDRVSGVPIVIRYDDNAFSAAAFARGNRIPGTFSYWFAWRRIHPATAVERE